MTMKKLSFWASNNKWKSWVLIAFFYYLLIVAAMFLANAAFFAGVSLNLYWLFATIGIITIIFGFYPLKNTKAYTFKNRKRADFALVISGFFLTFSLFNVMISEYEVQPSRTNPYAVQTILKPTADFEQESTLTKLRKRLKRRSYQRTQQFKAFWKAQNEGTQALLIILTILVAVLLFFGVTALGCAVACSGSEALGAAIFIVGYAGIIIGSIFAIRAIVRKGKKSKKPKTDNT